MRVFDSDNINQELLIFIRNWVKLLSEDKFSEACLLLDVPEEKEKSVIWNGDILKDVFDEYCWYKRRPVISNPYLMNLEKEKINFYEYNDLSGYAVEYDIPLDNEWGDLTAKFSFIKQTHHLYFIYLYSIRVL